MENFFSRYRNGTVLVMILFIQFIALATQVRVATASKEGLSAQSKSTRLIRVWAVGVVSPFQRLYVNSGLGIRNLWHNYIDLRGVRQRNARIQQELDQMRLEQTRIREDAEQGRRLQTLLGFKEQFIGHTLAAQVIGTSGTDLSRVIYIDRGSRNGIEPGMAVITADGIVGKISRADRSSSQVLLITDPSSGAGVIMERLRLNGVLKGSTSGYAEVQNIMADEEIKPGDRILTTGGDRVFPKGLPVGTVVSVSPDRDRDPFLAVKVKPAVNLAHLEEVLVITELKERGSASDEADASHPVRAADMLAERLPTYKKKAEQDELKAKNAKRKPGSAAQAAGSGETPPFVNAETLPSSNQSSAAVTNSSQAKPKTESEKNSNVATRQKSQNVKKPVTPPLPTSNPTGAVKEPPR